MLTTSCRGERRLREFGNRGTLVRLKIARGNWPNRGTLNFSFQLPLRVLPWVYDLSLGRGIAYSFWMRQLQEFAVPPRVGRVRLLHHSHPAPGHRARDCGRPSVNKRLLRSFGVLVPQFQAPAANLRRAMRCRSPLPALVAELQASVGLRCNRTPAVLQYRKTQAYRAAV